MRVSGIQNRGSVLIFALWALAFLGVLTAQIGLTIRARASLLARLEDRSQLHFIAEAGIKDGIAALRLDWERSNEQYTGYSKYYRHNNPEKFRSVNLGRGSYFVDYDYYDSTDRSPEKHYGMIDEESKININLADTLTLSRLFQLVLHVNEQDSLSLAEAIIDWRVEGKIQLTGFWSDDFYQNLKDPYESKEADFEIIDELKLVKGFQDANYDRLLPYLTIYGEGKVNINTASYEVLRALGLDHEVALKLLSVRRGVDDRDSTVDDHIFEVPHDVASEVANFVKMSMAERRQIDSLNGRGLISTDSAFYRIESTGRLNGSKANLKITCIYNIRDNEIEYWKEKYL